MVVTLEIPTGRRNPQEVLRQWTVGDLDVLYDDMGLSEEWQQSDRRRELYEFEQRDLEQLLNIIERVPVENWFEPLREYYGPRPLRTFYKGHDEKQPPMKGPL